MYYCCSINLKRQSEHSGLRPDTSSLVPIFNRVMKNYKNLPIDPTPTPPRLPVLQLDLDVP